MLGSMLTVLWADSAAVAAVSSLMSTMGGLVVVGSGICRVCGGGSGSSGSVHGRLSLSDDAASFYGNGNHASGSIGVCICNNNALADDAILAGEVLHEFRLSPADRSGGVNRVGEGLVVDRAS